MAALLKGSESKLACPSAEHQQFCRELQNSIAQCQTLYQQLITLQNISLMRFDLRRTFQSLMENTAQSLQYLSYVSAQECSKCKNL